MTTLLSRHTPAVCHSRKSGNLQVRVLIFDFDGVLVNTEPIHMQAWLDVLESLSISFTEKDYDERYIGLNDRDFLAKIFSERKRPLTPKLSDGLIHQKEVKTRETLSKNIPLIEGAEDFLKQSAERYPIGLVTGALRNEVYFILDQLGWRKYFSVVVTANDVEKGKPNPEGYLNAFETLSKIREWNPPLRKSECLVFEDSQNGINAARTAGLPCRVVKGSLSLP